MLQEKQNPNEPVRQFSPRAGVVLSLFVSGASHYLPGKRLEGIIWFLSSPLICVGFCWCLASPTVPGDLAASGLFFTYLVLMIVTLILSYRPASRYYALGWVGFVVLHLFIGEVVCHGILSFARPFEILAAAMSPTLQGNGRAPAGSKVSGDHIFIECYAYWLSQPLRGDIMVLLSEAISEAQRQTYSIPPDAFYVKRVAGISGDNLSIQNGHVYNHEKIVSEPQGLAKLEFSNGPYVSPYLSNPPNDYVVPKSGYFLVGDNTTNSLDNRCYGAVLGKGIVGKASEIYWPLQRIGKIQ